MRRRLIAVLLSLVVVGVVNVGCFSFVSWKHNENHLHAWENRLVSMHKSIDYFLLDYNWDDPQFDEK